MCRTGLDDPTPKDFLENTVLTVFDSFKSNDYVR